MSSPRRDFLQQAGSGLLAAWALPPEAFADVARAAGRAIAQPRRRPLALTAAQLASLEAVTGRIIPADETPGAREAGAAWFIDRMLAKWVPEQKGAVVAAIAACDAAAVAKGSAHFAALKPADQDAIISALTPETRGLLVSLTCAGLLCHPSQGGNRGEIGYRLVGHDSAMAFRPPYGYYDDPTNLSRLIAEATAARQREAGR
jgi:hypothetical protein